MFNAKLFSIGGGLRPSRLVYQNNIGGEAVRVARDKMSDRLSSREPDERYQKREASLKEAMQRRVRLEDMINPSDRDLVLSILETTMDEDLLNYFGRVEDSRYRAAVAANFNAPKELLAELADDPPPYVGYEVAKNPNTPAKILDKLWINPPEGNLRTKYEIYRWQHILIGLASNPNLDSTKLEKLWANNKWLEYAIAKNPSTPTWVLENIINVRTSDEDYKDCPTTMNYSADSRGYLTTQARLSAEQNLARRGTIFKDL